MGSVVAYVVGFLTLPLRSVISFAVVVVAVVALGDQLRAGNMPSRRVVAAAVVVCLALAGVLYVVVPTLGAPVLRQVQTTASEVVVAWEPPVSGYVSEYELFQRVGDSARTSLGTVGVDQTCVIDTQRQPNCFVYSNLSADTDYQFVARVHGFPDGPVDSNVVSVRTKRQSTEVTAPTDLHVRTTTTGTVELAWSAITGNTAAGYRIVRDDVPVGTVDQAAGSITFIDTGLTPATTYRYAVRTIDRSGNESAPTADVLAITTPAPGPTSQPGQPPAPPGPPRSLSAQLASETSVSITWTTPSFLGTGGLSHYKVVRGDGPTMTVAAGTTSFTWSSLTAGQTYTFGARAVSNHGLESGNSNMVQVTLPQPVTNPSAAKDGYTLTLFGSPVRCGSAVMVTAQGWPDDGDDQISLFLDGQWVGGARLSSGGMTTEIVVASDCTVATSNPGTGQPGPRYDLTSGGGDHILRSGRINHAESLTLTFKCCRP